MFTENEKLLGSLFDRALELRDTGDLPQAIRLLEEVVSRLQLTDHRLLSHSHMQLGYIHKLQGQCVESERHFRMATEARPKLELASLGLFNALENLGRSLDALAEAVRFLSLCESLGYRELFSGDTFGADVPDDERALATHARAFLDRHRETQRSRTVAVVGDTVRVGASAPEIMRPGSLATVRELPSSGFANIVFADGQSVEIATSLLDHRDI